MIAITEIFCDSSHRGSNCTSRLEQPDDDATVWTTVGAFVIALVHDISDV